MRILGLVVGKFSHYTQIHAFTCWLMLTLPIA